MICLACNEQPDRTKCRKKSNNNKKKKRKENEKWAIRKKQCTVKALVVYFDFHVINCHFNFQQHIVKLDGITFL